MKWRIWQWCNGVPNTECFDQPTVAPMRAGWERAGWDILVWTKTLMVTVRHRPGTSWLTIIVKS